MRIVLGRRGLRGPEYASSSSSGIVRGGMMFLFVLTLSRRDEVFERRLVDAPSPFAALPA